MVSMVRRAKQTVKRSIGDTPMRVEEKESGVGEGKEVAGKGT